MKKYVLICCLVIFRSILLPAQDSILHRIILVGDAGEIHSGQSSLLRQASDLVLAGRSTTVFLGDNIYPRGMGLPGSRDEERSKQILKSQFQPFRSKHAAVFFIPGNHDWDNSGRFGLEKVKAEWKFIHDQADDSLSFLPADGCPDPVAVQLTPNLAMIAFDSEWWLNPKGNNDPECRCKTKKDVIRKLAEFRDRFQNSNILFVTHHPFRSFGIHGSYFSLKDYLFPLTGISEYLYLPMPVIGSLYPLLRTIFVNKQDLKHPDYIDMVKRVSDVFAGKPNVVYASGHEHGLQLIKDSILQIVSGAGAKTTHLKKKKHSLFKSSRFGFAVLDMFENQNARLDFYVVKGKLLVKTFSYDIPELFRSSAKISK